MTNYPASYGTRDAFLVVDAHGTFTRKNPQTTARINTLMDTVRGKGVIVRIRMNEEWPIYPDRIHPDGAIHERMGIVPNDDPMDLAVIGEFGKAKFGTDAFEGGFLNQFLGSMDVKNVHIVGFETGVCVKQTVRGALAAGFNTNLITDCTADTQDKIKNTALLTSLRNEGATMLVSASYPARLSTTPNGDIRALFKKLHAAEADGALPQSPTRSRLPGFLRRTNG